MPSRRFDANNNQLVTAAGQTRGALWTAAAWLHIGEAIGKDTSNWNAILISVSATTPYGASGLRVAKSGSRWFLSAIHDMSTADGYVIAAMPFELRDWIFVAAAHGSDGTEPRIWCGTPTAPIVAIPPYLTNHTAGTGSSVTATGNYYVGGYGANNIIAGCVAWPAWWVGAVLSAGELDTYRAETAVGRWPNIGKESLLGLWPLGETNATASGRDLSGGAKTLTASNFATGDIGPGVDDIAVADDWWWRDIEAPAAGSNATVTPNAVTASVAVPASTRTASGTVTPAAVAASVTVPAPTVAGTATARDLDGSDDQFAVTAAPAYTGDWTWCGHVTLDAAGGYLWRAQTSGGTACQTVAVKTIGGRVRLEATQGRATTGAVCQWEMPLPLGTDLTLAVQYESSTGRFRAWAGLADVPMTELAWRYSQTLGSGASTGSGTDWYISPSTGRVDGSISWVTVAPNITATKADFEGVRLFWDPPYAWTGSSGGSWKFDESSGNAADTSGNGRTMIASGTPSVRARTQTPYPESSVALTLTGVPDCRIYQRNGSNQFPVPIAGTFGGTPEKIEARFTPFGATPGSWTTIDAAPSGGTYSGTLTVDLGQGILEVRADQGLSGSEHVYTYIRRFGVGVGDVYLAVGTSNASGIELNGGYNRVDAWLTDYEFGSHPFPVQMSNRKVANETHEWHEIHDPTDAYSAASTDLPSRTNSIYGPSSSWTQGTYTPTDNTTDTTSSGAGKSMWPALASLILQHQGVPVAIVPVAKGGSNLASWHLNVANYWNDLRARCEELAGVSISDSTPLDGTQAIGVLAVHGENDYGANPATYEANSSTLGSIRYWCVNNVLGNLGLPTWLMVTGDWPGTSAYNYTAAPQDGITRVRAANQAAWAELPVLPGPVTYELDLADGGGDGFHYRTQAELDTVTKRWYACIVEAWYGGASGSSRGPQVTGCTRSGTTVTVQMDVALDAAAGGYDGISVYDGTPAPGTRLTWVSSAPSAGQYTAVRGGTTSQVIITLGAAPSGTVYFGVGEYDLSAGKTVPSVTRTVGGVAVTLPAEVATGVAASVAPAPSAVAATATVPAPTRTASGTVTPSAVTTTVTVPPPTRTATATVTAGSVASTVTVPSPIVGVTITVAPSAVAATVAVPPPTRIASATASPSAVTAAATVQTPGVAAGSSVTIAPSTITISTSVPAPTRVATATATPAMATTTVTVLTPAITAGSSTTVVPAAVTAAVTVPSAATASSTIAAPATVTTTVIVQAPTRAATGTATPAAVAATVTVPTPGVSTGSSATASPPTIASTVVVASTTSTATATIPAAAATATVAVLAPAIQAGSSTTVIAAVVTASAAVPAAARTASATVTAALAATTAQALPATVQIAGPTTVAAPRVTAAAAVLTVWVSTGATTADQWRVAGRLSRKWRAGGLSR